MRAITTNWDIGGRLGVQYTSDRFEDGFIIGDATFRNRMSLVGTYHF